VDRAAREVIRKAGFAKYFVHRTGHNIGQEVHGTGANMDGLETRDIRRIIPRTCFFRRARNFICPSLACAVKSMCTWKKAMLT